MIVKLIILILRLFRLLDYGEHHPKKVKENLIILGYFNHVDKMDRERIINESIKGYRKTKTIDFNIDGLNRVFWISANSAYEGDGIKDLIDSMIPLFRKMGINLVIDDYIEVFDNNINEYTCRKIVLNGIEYNLTRTFDHNSAFVSSLRLIYNILHDYNSKEIPFGLFIDDPITMIFLTESQFRYFQKILPNSCDYKPIDFRRKNIG